MVTHLKPDVLECKVKWSLGSIITDKPSRDDGILAELFKLLKDDAVKSPAPYCSQDGEGLYGQQKQDWELPVTQIMNSLLPNSNLN